jgi:cobalt/nickel transport system permease protein
MDDQKVPLMGVLGAFIFAAQMINFAIPGTGSSGHLGGGMILAILLGPCAAFLVMASVLSVQALFFADGGLLALGASIFNLGAFPCFIAYPLIYKPLAGKNPSRTRITLASLAAAVAGLQLGSLGVVTQTVLSGVSELPFGSFLLVMQPIHLVIGIVEGLVTGAVITFVWKAQPDILSNGMNPDLHRRSPIKKVLAGLIIAALVTGGGLSWFASSNPDGLEWAIARVSGQEELQSPDKGIHRSLEGVQEKTAVLPDYGLRSSGGKDNAPETALSGIVGGILTLVIALGVGWILRRKETASGERQAVDC